MVRLNVEEIPVLSGELSNISVPYTYIYIYFTCYSGTIYQVKGKHNRV